MRRSIKEAAGTILLHVKVDDFMGEYLGQHFLINKSKLRKIIDALELKSGDIVIEIGPGHGELTELIARNFQFLPTKCRDSDFIIENYQWSVGTISNFQLVLIEKDKNFIEILKRKFSENKNIKIVEGDALQEIKNQISFLRSKSPEGQIKIIKQNFKIIQNLKIVGNIPYYITGRILRVIGELKNKPSLVVLTIQKEVAERVSAQPPKMNLLAASVQFWAKTEIIGYISKKYFRPRPMVDSAIIKLVVRDTLTCQSRQKRGGERCEDGKYYRILKILFKQPRKTIWNNIKNQISNIKDKEKIVKELQKIGINPNDRPQNLSLEQLLLILSTSF